MQSHSKAFSQQHFQRRPRKLRPSRSGSRFPLDCLENPPCVCAQRGGPCGGKPRDYRTTSQKWSVPALAGWRHRKVTSPRDWSQSKDPSLGRSASPFFISPGSFNANLLNCLFIAGSSRLVELRNVYSCTVVYRAALRHGIYYVWSFITTIHIRADGEHESNTALLLPTALCYRWQEIGDPKAQ